MALNPIAFTEAVVDDFLRYQLTTYPLADVDLHAQLRALLNLEVSRQTPLRQGPYISLSRPFEEGASVKSLISEGIFHPWMDGLTAYPGLRKHQETAVRAITAGRHTLVATGTGSGKTEAFLYPIISRCLALQEAKAPPGIVAVLVYPMNALAQDQLDRLRGLLAGRGVTFGLYVRDTPEDPGGVRGERLPAGSSNADYHARLTALRGAGEATTLLPQEEKASRQAMRAEPPRILLTNVKQLELVLTRGKDVGLFAGADLQFVVFDEAHTFRGAQGAETACLIRRLRHFCGRAPDQVVGIATSATMADPVKGQAAGVDFARRFFGVDEGQVELVGEAYAQQAWNVHRTTPVGPTDGPKVLERLLAAVDVPDDQVAAALSACLIDLGGAPLPPKHWQKALYSQLASNEIVFQLAEALEKPRELKQLPAMLAERVGREVAEAEVLCWLALGAACARGDHDPLLRPVVHAFVRGVGGAVVTFAEGVPRLWLAGEDAAKGIGEAWRRLPVLSCTTCGQHYFEDFVDDFRLVLGRKSPEGGERKGDVRVWPHRAEGGDRVLLLDRLVVAPDEDDEADDEAGGDLDGHDLDHPRLMPLYLCAACGSLQIEATSHCAECHAEKRQVAVQAVRNKPEMEGILHSCVACQAPARRVRGSLREPARPVRAVGVSDVHVLAQSMIQLSERRRLLVFADNRQDAAFQAGWMQDHARRFRLRALMMAAIPPQGASIGDLVSIIDAQIEADPELSRVLLPEVWAVQPFEESGAKHQEERKYYLRIQVLRELATGVKQRLGLEPWGRLRVEYHGLEDLGFIEEWATRLGVPVKRLREGVAAVLDHLRRLRLVADRLFQIWWGMDKREVNAGYFPPFPGGPRGMKLRRSPDDEPSRCVQWLGSRATQLSNAVGAWGLPAEEVEPFLEGLWKALIQRKILVPATLTGRWNKALPGSGLYQIEPGHLRLVPHDGRWRCQKCRRTTVRRGPTDRCLAWRCGGALVWEVPSTDDFDLHTLDAGYAMLRVAEHSAQVPHALRERYENWFKGTKEHLNTLVCTPTLELGVDIGALDAVLMRNVPPTAANYWQRAGRAGRRHRMAVDLTYAQATGFDQAYFREPLKLLGGQVEPPRFNLKNRIMIRKHVHATVLTTLNGLARQPQHAETIKEVVARCLPGKVKPWLFEPDETIRKEALDVSALGALIQQHRPALVAAVVAVFTEAWPGEDTEAVQPEPLAAAIDGMAAALQAVIGRLKRRLDWALGEIRRLNASSGQKGTLDPEDQAHRRRCERVIDRFKSKIQKRRSEADGGASDDDTFGVLAREGFLPGYGLQDGSIVGEADPPRFHPLDPFALPRPPALALREYVPGNAIYANGLRFVPRRFHITPDDVLRFSVVVEQQVVQQVGTETTKPLSTHEIRAIPVCDVDLPSQSQISDEEDFRFQMPVAVYGQERGFERGGQALVAGSLDVRHRRGVYLRLVNVGARSETKQARLGYPICLTCGQSSSPFSSAEARTDFEAKHAERCGHIVRPTGFYADIEADLVELHHMPDATSAFSLAEALRLGAARVLDMEVEDLQLLALRAPGAPQVDLLLYDPMPGGSGLLDHLIKRWPEVVARAAELVASCPSACERSCVDCLQTYRNRFYHEHLDRHVAQEALRQAAAGLTFSHLIPEKLPKTTTTTGLPQTAIEKKFKDLLKAAGLPDPQAQHTIPLGPGYGHTVPDFFYVGPDEDEPGTCIYLDGMAGHIHGNPEQKAKDLFLRERLNQLGYTVVALSSTELDDQGAVVSAIARIARSVVGKEKMKALKADISWLEGPKAKVIAFRRVTVPGPLTLPILDLAVAAGGFSETQAPDVAEHLEVPAHLHGPGRFAARIVGDSMSRIVPPGGLALFEHLRASGATPAASGEYLVLRREDGGDPELGGYTFKQLLVTHEGRFLVPHSDNPVHTRTRVPPEAKLEFLCRLVCAVESVAESR